MNFKLRERLFGSNEPSGYEKLVEALQEPRESVDFYGVVQRPYLDEQGADSAVFPVAVYDEQNGERYSTTYLEFFVNDDSERETLDTFLESVGDGSLPSAEGTEVDVTRTSVGEYLILW